MTTTTAQVTITVFERTDWDNGWLVVTRLIVERVDGEVVCVEQDVERYWRGENSENCT